MRKLYSKNGDGWVLAGQLHKAINEALVEGGGSKISRQMFYTSVMGRIGEDDKARVGKYIYVREEQLGRWVSHAKLRCEKIKRGEWLKRHAWGDDEDEAFRLGRATVVVDDGELVMVPEGAVVVVDGSG